MLCGVLTAQQDGIVDGALDVLLGNAPFLHQCQKLALINFPALMLLPIGVQHLPGWRQLRHVNVIHFAKFPQKPSQIILFSETGKPESIPQPHIHQPFCSRFSQQSKESLRRLFSESNRINFHSASSQSPGLHPIIHKRELLRSTVHGFGD